jgi:hypothetical protein
VGVPPAPGGPSSTLGTLRDILGWTWKPGDVAGFQAALRASYSISEEKGIRHWKYTPTGTAVRADLGAVSGSQAIILQQIRAAQQRIVPELESIPPLRINPDPQRISAMRLVTVADLNDLASELAKVDGPLVSRVDGLWTALVGNPPDDLDPEEPDPLAHLGQMKDVFGFDRELVNTVEQELILSRWLAIVSELTSLYVAYQFQRDYFTGAKTPYFGTSLVIISQWLEVIGDSVREFQAALTSHFIEEAEQDRLVLRTGDAGAPLYLGAVLAWAERVPGEAQSLLQGAGKQGARSLIGPLQELHAAVRAARPPIAGAPYLYNSSPIIRSTQAVLEAAILRTWQTLLPFDVPGEGLGEEEPGGGQGQPPPPWIQPSLGGSPVEMFQPVHFREPLFGIRAIGGPRRDAGFGLRAVGGGPMIARADAERVGDELRAEIPIDDVPPGAYELVVTSGRQEHPFHIVHIGGPIAADDTEENQ